MEHGAELATAGSTSTALTTTEVSSTALATTSSAGEALALTGASLATYEAIATYSIWELINKYGLGKVAWMLITYNFPTVAAFLTGLAEGFASLDFGSLAIPALAALIGYIASLFTTTTGSEELTVAEDGQSDDSTEYENVVNEDPVLQEHRDKTSEKESESDNTTETVDIQKNATSGNVNIGTTSEESNSTSVEVDTSSDSNLNLDLDEIETETETNEVELEINNGLEALEQFTNTMKTETSSDAQVVELLYNTLYSEIEENENVEAAIFIQMLVTLQQTNSNLNFQVSEKGSYYDAETYTVYIDESDLEYGSVLLHEIGNMLFETLISEEDIPENANDILDEAQFYVSEEGSTELEEMVNSINKLNSENLSIAENKVLQEEGYETIEDYIKEYAESNNISEEDATEIIQNRIEEVYEDITKAENSGSIAFLNIVSTITEWNSENEEINNVQVLKSLMADFTQLKVDGDEMYLEAIKNCFGSEFYDLLENLYNVFYN